MGRATGIGGVFFRARDTEALAKWYEEHLGLPSFWTQEAGPTVLRPSRPIAIISRLSGSG